MMVIYNQIQQQPQQNPGEFLCHAGGGLGGKDDVSQPTGGKVLVGKGGSGGGSADDDATRQGGGAGLFDGKSAPLGHGVNLNGTDAGKDNGFGYGGSGSVAGSTIGIRSGASGAVRIIFGGKNKTYDKPGKYEFIVPNDVNKVEITCIGGGGSGFQDRDGDGNGSGGSGGAYAKNDVRVKPGSTLQVVVGSGGIAPQEDGSKNGEDSYVKVLRVPEKEIVIKEPEVIDPPPPLEEIQEVFACEGDFNWCWEQVNFPYDGAYTIEFEADDAAELSIGGRKIETVVLANPKIFQTNLSAGRYDICIKLTNIALGARTFEGNPTAVGLVIKYKKAVFGDGASWVENPMGISAALVAPPCPKPAGGVGVVTAIYPINPGNGYPTNSGGGEYPVAIIPSGFDIINTGIGYNLGDELIFDPPIEPPPVICEVGPYGDVQKICFTPNPLIPGIPRLVGTTGTGVNLETVPILVPIRDPIDVDPEKLIQVTDLVGLKQTGYINGRAYFGAVFYKDGVPYAGYYETAGQLIQVYDTLQESIDAQVTTEPSAIQRSGTDIRSNDPRLNIPGTPQSTTEI